jgi:capsular polysaccharide transport system permease protein
MRAFLTSREVMERMEEQHGYLSHLQSAADGIGGVRGVGGLRDPLAYYQSRVNVTINVQEGLAVLKVRANTQADAERYAGYLIGYARARLADTAQQLNTDQLEGLQEEVATARNEVNEAANALGEVQQARGELDPVAAASAVYQLIGGLELRLTEVRAQRDSLLSNGLDRSPLLPRLNAQIATLERQIDEQRARLAGDGSQSVQRSALLLERARARKELADATLAATLQTMEQARVEALKRREYLVVIAPPSAPLLPNVGRTARAISWLILLAVLAGVIWVAWQRLRERRRNDADDALWDEED